MSPDLPRLALATGMMSRENQNSQQSAPHMSPFPTSSEMGEPMDASDIEHLQAQRDNRITGSKTFRSSEQKAMYLASKDNAWALAKYLRSISKAITCSTLSPANTIIGAVMLRTNETQKPTKIAGIENAVLVLWSLSPNLKEH